jgi:hypothetical protein
VRFRFRMFKFESKGEVLIKGILLTFNLFLFPVKKHTAENAIFLFPQSVQFTVIEPTVDLNSFG